MEKPPNGEEDDNEAAAVDPAEDDDGDSAIGEENMLDDTLPMEDAVPRFEDEIGNAIFRELNRINEAGSNDDNANAEELFGHGGPALIEIPILHYGPLYGSPNGPPAYLDLDGVHVYANANITRDQEEALRATAEFIRIQSHEDPNARHHFGRGRGAGGGGSVSGSANGNKNEESPQR